MATTPDSTTQQPEQTQPVSDELYRLKGSGKSGFQRRIDRITARNHAMEERIIDLESQIRELSAKVRGLREENEFF